MESRSRRATDGDEASVAVEFALVPIAVLRLHEEIEPDRVEEVRSDIVRSGAVEEPILVARGSMVVLNGHHRLAALRSLGVARVPVFLVDYHDDRVRLERWGPGPSLSKAEVVATAHAGRVYPPKTTKHTLTAPLPRRRTPLEELRDP